ncbi:MAG: hypothetical protein NC041_09555 [Bacteroides sp.]|nr:hypothetical protein [Prevotella sp.]MCM1408781.1 hypothetical protein [Treponema brennaborense]MCM1470696.1 hypothetical protein [Bacteroides sp.]
MNEEEVCEAIYALVLPVSNKIPSPVAYINVKLGFDCPFAETALWNVFNKIKWNTPLSSAELFISRNSYTGTPDTSVCVESLSFFESSAADEQASDNTDSVVKITGGAIC